MAHDNIEVEIKVKLTKAQYNNLHKKLLKIAKFEKLSNQKDDYYAPDDNRFLLHKYPYEWLTVRKRDGMVKINYKHWYPEGVKYTTHCDEYETVVESDVQIENILEALRFTKFISVEKKRLVFVYKSELEIALDAVSDLGYFIEVEALKDFGGHAKTHEKLLKFLRSVGITKSKTIPGGYASELMRKKGIAFGV